MPHPTEEISSPLSSALCSLLRNKGLPTIQLVVDNAVAPSDELIDQALDYEESQQQSWMDALTGEEDHPTGTRSSDEGTTSDKIIDEALSIVRGEKRSAGRSIRSSEEALSVVQGKGILRSGPHRKTPPPESNNGIIKVKERVSFTNDDLKNKNDTRKRDWVSCEEDDHKDTRWEVSPTSSLQSPVRRLSASELRRLSASEQHRHFNGTLDITNRMRDFLSIKPEGME
jgi:hypothetical protein